MNRALRAAAGLALAAALLPAGTAAADPIITTDDPGAAVTTTAAYATFNGVFKKNAAGDYESSTCFEVVTRYPGNVFPCIVAFRFPTPLRTICDPRDNELVKAGTADYHSVTAGQKFKNNQVTSGGEGSTYRHVHGAIVDLAEPTFFDIDIDLSEVCDATVEGRPKYPAFTGIVTYT